VFTLKWLKAQENGFINGLFFIAMSAFHNQQFQTRMSSNDFPTKFNRMKFLDCIEMI